MYKDFFGLNRNPFELSPDPSFTFASENSRQALASIMYAVAKRKGFVVLTGEVGTGKTLIVRSLFQLWKREQIAFANIFAPNLSVIDFLRSTASDLGIEVREPTKGTLLQGLYRFLVAQFEKGHTTVLVIDEAHQVPTSVLEEIRMLTNLETDEQKLVQVLLVGQPELDGKLDSFELRQLKQRIAVRCHLEPFCEEETRDYIERRLELAGAKAQAKTTFPAETLKAIYCYSRGIPRLINAVCDRALVAAYARQLRVVPVETISEVASYLHLQDLRPTKTLPWLSQHREDLIWDVTSQAATAVRASATKTTDPDTFANDVDARCATSSEDTPPSKLTTLYEDSLGDIPGIAEQELSASLHAQSEAENGPGRDSQEFGGLDRASRNGERLATFVPADRTAVSAATTSVTEACLSAPIQQSSPAHESNVFAATAKQLTPCEAKTVAPAAATRQLDQSLRDTRPRQPSRSLERSLRLSLFVTAAAVVLVALLVTGVLMARRQKGAVSVPQQAANTLDTFLVGQVAATMQPVGTNSATQFDVGSVDPPVAETDSGTSKSTVPLEHLAARAKIVAGTLSRPVVRSSHPSTSTEPPLIMTMQTSELPVGNGLLGSPVPTPTPPMVTGGGDLQPPKLVSSSPPVYPSVARLENLQGVAVIDVLVDATGKVTDMMVISGSPRLAQAAMDALRTWKYEPARLNGQPIAMHTHVSINFSLH